ncbi:nuclear lim interactor-interacting factor [Diplonema papillatum]|nr:nuclear lim interactor-interacting factor [Diplonema papillatum]
MAKEDESEGQVTDRSTDDTVGHEGADALRKDRAVTAPKGLATAGLRRGVPDAVKAKGWQSTAARRRQSHTGASATQFAPLFSVAHAKPSAGGKSRSRTPPLTARAPGTPTLTRGRAHLSARAHLQGPPPASFLALTGTAGATAAIPATTLARRRSLTPTGAAPRANGHPPTYQAWGALHSPASPHTATQRSPASPYQKQPATSRGPAHSPPAANGRAPLHAPAPADAKKSFLASPDSAKPAPSTTTPADAAPHGGSKPQQTRAGGVGELAAALVNRRAAADPPESPKAHGGLVNTSAPASPAPPARTRPAAEGLPQPAAPRGDDAIPAAPVDSGLSLSGQSQSPVPRRHASPAPAAQKGGLARGGSGGVGVEDDLRELGAAVVSQQPQQQQPQTGKFAGAGTSASAAEIMKVMAPPPTSYLRHQPQLQQQQQQQRPVAGSPRNAKGGRGGVPAQQPSSLTFSKPNGLAGGAAGAPEDFAAKASLLSQHSKSPGAAKRRSATATQPLPARRHQPTFVGSLPLPARHHSHSLTVVFDLDQTLVNAHSPQDVVVPRPGLLESLEAIGKCRAERVLWTASNEAQARFVLKKIPGLAQHFDYLVTWDTAGWGNRRDYVKDILKLRRHLSTTLVIDNDHLVVRPHIPNALVVEDYGDLQGESIPDTDTVMQGMVDFVRALSTMQPVIDVPSYVKATAEWVGRKKTGFYFLRTDDSYDPADAGASEDEAREHPLPPPHASAIPPPGAAKPKRALSSQTHVTPGTAGKPAAFQRTTTSVKKRQGAPARALFAGRKA